MKIGVLEVGLLNDKLKDKFPPYTQMFDNLLRRSGREVETRGYVAILDEFPESIDECDGWLITGSRHGVYENLEWMQRLQAFIRELHAAKKSLIGICFGHQIVAQALGGDVVKSEKGWGVGLSSYRVEKVMDWIKTSAEQVRIHAFHQDQVIRLPTDAEVFLSSEFCPYAGLCYGDSIMTIQAHPEFEADYELALLNLYNGDILPEPVANAALASINDSPHQADTQILAEWMMEFYSNQIGQ